MSAAGLPARSILIGVASVGARDRVRAAQPIAALATPCCAACTSAGEGRDEARALCSRVVSSTSSSTRGRGRRRSVASSASSSTTSTNEHLYLAPFVAHGFQVVSEEADICYLHSRPYEPGAELAVAWNDPSLAIGWPILPPSRVGARRDGAGPRRARPCKPAFERS